MPRLTPRSPNLGRLATTATPTKGPDFAIRQVVAVFAAAFISTAPAVIAPPTGFAATDGAAIGTCLITKAPLALARCVTDPICATNLLCIQTCTGRADEATCQINCGDKFANSVTEGFTKAAVTDSKCVPQRDDDGSWPVPKDEALVDSFTTEALEGDWYISAGYNKAFDTFDCQLHRFEAPSPSTLVGNMQWRIKDPVAGTNFVTRYTVQTFEQDKTRPGILYNHDNEFLHYQDDWYILGQKPAVDDAKGKGGYVLVYYKGSNDAWDGYGGAVVYTRDPKLRPEYIPSIEKDLQKVGLKWSDFTQTDNSCNAGESKFQELEADLVFVEGRVAAALTTFDLAGLEKQIEQEVVKEVKEVERVIEKDVEFVEEEVSLFAQGIRALFGGSR